MARGYSYKSDRNGNGCSTVYRPRGENRTKPRGKAALGRVCYRDDAANRDTRWVAQVTPVPGTEPARGYGATRNAAVAEALESASVTTSGKDRVLTITEVAALTGIPRRTLAWWVERGHLLSLGFRHRVHLVRCDDVREAARKVQRQAHVRHADRCR
jgi:hypothetical protein